MEGGRIWVWGPFILRPPLRGNRDGTGRKGKKKDPYRRQQEAGVYTSTINPVSRHGEEHGLEESFSKEWTAARHPVNT